MFHVSSPYLNIIVTFRRLTGTLSPILYKPLYRNCCAIATYLCSSHLIYVKTRINVRMTNKG